MRLFTALLTLFATCVAAAAHADTCAKSGGQGDAAAVSQALDKLRPLLSEAQRASLEHPFDYDTATRWSNLPVGIVPRTGLRLGDLDAAQTAAARRVFEAALSACGLRLLDEVRLADDWLVPYDKRPIGWGGGNYYLTVLGTAGGTAPWMLQVGGHHLAYNFTFNGRDAGATPLFFGSEPIRFEMKGVAHAPLDAQSTAMSKLAAAVASAPQAKLAGTFTDVVKGVVASGTPGGPMHGGTDTGFPQTYPSGASDRGIAVSTLSTAQKKLVREAIESFASFPGRAITRPLLAAYLDPKSLAETYVGYSGTPDLGTRGSYIRVDGPRVWMELVVQPAIAHPQELHYHALWRDKQSDYGGEVHH